MIELARSLQYTNHLIVALCVTMAIYASTPDSREQALGRIQTLRSLDREDFGDFATRGSGEGCRLLQEKGGSFLRAAERLPALSPGLVRCAGVSHHVLMPERTGGPSMTTPRLREIAAWARTRTQVAVFVPEPEGAAAIQRAVLHARATHPGFKVDGVGFRAGVDAARPPTAPAGERARARIVVWLDRERPPARPADGLFAYPQLDRADEEGEEVPGTLHLLNVVDPYLRDHGISGTEELLSAIGEYDAETVAEAIAGLKQIASLAPTQLSIAGISVRGQGLALTGQLALLLALLYLLGHVAMVQRAIRRPGADVTALRHMPWVGFMPGWIGRLLTALFVFALPAGTVALLARRFHHEHPHAAIVVAALPILAAGYAWLEVERLRRCVLAHGQPVREELRPEPDPQPSPDDGALGGA